MIFFRYVKTLLKLGDVKIDELLTVASLASFPVRSQKLNNTKLQIKVAIVGNLKIDCL